MANVNRSNILIQAVILVAIPCIASSSEQGACQGEYGPNACLGDQTSLIQASSIVEKRARGDSAHDMKNAIHHKSSLMSLEHGAEAIHEHAHIKSSDSSHLSEGSQAKEVTKTRISAEQWGFILVGVGVALIGFSVKSIARTKEEMGKIQNMYDAETDASTLKDAMAAGELPSVVIMKGVLTADGPDVTPAAPSITGLSAHVNEIEQPENALVNIARFAKAQPDNPLSKEVEKRTGLRAEDVPDVEDDFTKRTASYKEGPCVLAEALVARLGVMTYKVRERDEDDSGRRRERIEVRRSERKHSYNVFHARRFSQGLHLLDANGQRIDLELPDANVVKTIGLGEQPSLFLATADAFQEFSNHVRKDGLTVNGEHVDMSQMPPTTVTEPATMLSKFIFMDFQTSDDLGLMPTENPIAKIALQYGRDGVKDFLWEPKGFYDYETEVSTRATYSRRELVSADELIERAKTAASENPLITDFCEPTFSREDIRQRRDRENCFRFTELCIPRGSEVTILARPVPVDKGGFKLVPPSDAENGQSSDDPEAQRFRLRILKGHTVENLLKQRNVNIMQYYGMALVGAFLVLGGGGTLVSSFVD